MKHHFVPEFLLRAWANTTADGMIEVFRLDLPRLPSRRWAPSATGFEHDLYALTKPEVLDVKQQATETDFLQLVDSEAARVLSALSTRGFEGLRPRDLVSWAYFIISLLFRTPEAVSWLRTNGSKHLKASLNARPKEYEAVMEACDPPTLVDFVHTYYPGFSENFGLMSLGKLICAPERVRKILSMRWWLCDFSQQSNDLVLADRPCILTGKLDDPNLLAALPVGPSKAFIATKSDKAAKVVLSQRRQTLLTQINESSLSQAKQRLYTRDESPRRFIANRLAKWKPSQQ